MKINEAVRVIKEKEALPDGSTLEEHGIRDGSTVSIVIEPEKKLNLTMKLGPKTWKKTVSNSERVCDLKTQLVEGRQVIYAVNEIELIVTADDNDGIEADILLGDDSLPLHMCAVSNNMVIKVIGGKVTLKVVAYSTVLGQYDTEKKEMLKCLPRSMSLKELLNDTIEHDRRKNMWLFRERRGQYVKLDAASEEPIGVMFCNTDAVYFVENKDFHEGQTVRCFFKGKNTHHSLINFFLGEMIGRVGYIKNEIALFLKLRVQGQFGVPVTFVEVLCNGNAVDDKERYLQDDHPAKLGVYVPSVSALGLSGWIEVTHKYLYPMYE